ncbi:MAG: hypothetical protein COA88_00630 [Kordia sp.]|nr:MAG: hypothetical protein COA88_00630 [Kordia sp.]
MLLNPKKFEVTLKKPIHWRLLITKEVPDTETVQLCIEWYICKWVIEEVFRILKKEALYNEDRLETVAKEESK